MARQTFKGVKWDSDFPRTVPQVHAGGHRCPTLLSPALSFLRWYYSIKMTKIREFRAKGYDVPYATLGRWIRKRKRGVNEILAMDKEPKCAYGNNPTG